MWGQVLCTKVRKNISEITELILCVLHIISAFTILCFCKNSGCNNIIQNQNNLVLTGQYHSLQGLLFHHTHTRTHTNMLTCSSVTRKTVTGCGLGTKTFSELSDDAWSQDAPSQNVKNFRCQNRQVQALIWGEMILKELHHSQYILQRGFAFFLTRV